MNTAWKLTLAVLFIMTDHHCTFAQSLHQSSSQHVSMRPSESSVTSFPKLFPTLNTTIQRLEQDFAAISSERKEQLHRIADFVRSSNKEHGVARLTFICTHNSRRSHIAQLWAKAAAEYYGIRGVETYSGGTETTAFNPRAVAAMRRVGFIVEEENGKGSTENPVYRVSFGQTQTAITAFSKRYDHPSNPHQHFAAVMVCSHAEEHCPFISGANKRLSLPYNDPKEFDGTPLETSKYDERVQEIGRDMIFLMSHVIQP